MRFHAESVSVTEGTRLMILISAIQKNPVQLIELFMVANKIDLDDSVVGHHKLKGRSRGLRHSK